MVERAASSAGTFECGPRLWGNEENEGGGKRDEEGRREGRREEGGADRQDKTYLHTSSVLVELLYFLLLLLLLVLVLVVLAQFPFAAVPWGNHVFLLQSSSARAGKSLFKRGKEEIKK